MNWQLAISRHLATLRVVLAELTAMAARAGSLRDLRQRREREAGSPSADRSTSGAATADVGAERDDARPLLSRYRHRAILRLLRPAESAARRLVIVAALKGGMVETPVVLSARPPGTEPAGRPRRPVPIRTTSALLRRPGGTGILMPPGHPSRLAPPPSLRRITLPLADPPRRLRVRRVAEADAPRISFPGWSVRSPLPVRQPSAPDDLLDATRVLLRLEALGAALDDLPGAARRFLRQQARREAARRRAAEGVAATLRPGERPVAPPRHIRLSPLRSGRPPGGLRRPRHEVHDLVGDLHGLAYQAIEHPDTS